MKERLLYAAIAVFFGLVASAAVSANFNGHGPSAGFMGLFIYLMVAPGIIVISSIVAVIGGSNSEAGRIAGALILGAIAFIAGAFFFH